MSCVGWVTAGVTGAMMKSRARRREECFGRQMSGQPCSSDLRLLYDL
jgi:hypothetical protein